ncbi:MAG: sensor histidine kinase [Micromonosporaceae bacterium]|nr:sensor histidine kinase [Micromonosporaceae bacterium]
MTAQDRQDALLERADARMERVLSVLPYPILAFSALATALLWPETWPARLTTLGLAASAAAWMFALTTAHKPWTGRRTLMIVYGAGLVAFAAVLAYRSPIYGFFSWSVYLHEVRYLSGRWRWAGFIATAAVNAGPQMGGFPRLSLGPVLVYLGVFAFNVVVVVLVMRAALNGERLSQQRKEVIAELADANSRLEAALAENAGLHAQLMTQAREAGILDERQRMAREIHDTLAQGLIGVITQLEAAEQAVQRTAADPPAAADARRHLVTAAQLARDSLSEARRSVRALRPEPLAGAGLPEALADVATKWSAVTGVAASVSTTGTATPMRPEIEVALLRTAQEALANVAKHANASRVGLTLSYMEDVVTLDVRDDGGGFDPVAIPSTSDGGGFGLTALRERLRGVAGALAVESEPGAGTAISATVPAVAV